MEARRERAADEAYGQLRVYHGTHDANADGILRQGLRPQGGEGLSGLIGDTSRSSGKVFYTKNKEQAAYYALTLAGTERIKRVKAARGDDDAIGDIYENPPKATLLRAIVPKFMQAQAVQDTKGADEDFTLDATIPRGNVLPGHLQPNADLTQRQGAVTAFRQEMQHGGVNVTDPQALSMLDRRRKLSVSKDNDALTSPYAKESSRSAIDMYQFKSGF